VHSDTEAPGGHCQIESRLLQLKICLNGHEWVKRQLRRRRLAFTALANGVLTCANPAALHAVCDSLTEGDIESFFKRWLGRLPLPLTAAHRAAGFSYRLSILQMEVSRTQVLDRPLRGREFFEEILRDNLDLVERHQEARNCGPAATRTRP
jgi:hypothetical protein